MRGFRSPQEQLLSLVATGARWFLCTFVISSAAWWLLSRLVT